MTKTAAYPAMNELLQQPLGNVVPAHRQVVYVHQSSTVKHALEMLGQHHILSLVVVRSNEDDSGVEWLGFVSYTNLIRFLGSKESKKEFFSSTMKEVIAFSRSAPFQIEERSKIIDAVEFFGSLGRLHRCGVYNHKTGRRNVCSQSDIVRFVAHHMFDTEELKNFANTKISDIGWGHRHPVSVRTDQTLHDALNILIQSSFSCIAVVDTKGSLIGNFSASDLRGLGEALLNYLKMPIGEFLKIHSPSAFCPKSESVVQTIGVLLNRMSEDHLHHLWLEDPSGKPEGLVTLTDVMNMLIKYTPNN